MNFNFDSLPNFDVKITHRNWQIALAEAFALIVSASPGEVVCITGPSRAGKSKLISELRLLLCGKDMFHRTGKMPSVVVEAVNTGPNGSFSTKSFTLHMLNAIRHPIFSESVSDLEESLIYHKTDRSTEASLRIALERAFVVRGTKYLFIDEAQHAKYAGKASMGAYAVMDSWKCLAQTSKLVLVLVGAYPIVDILQNSPHMLGRKKQVHLPRYRPISGDIDAFSQILASYDAILDLDGGVKSLTQFGELIYEGTFGCIGLVRSWLSQASAIARLEGTGINKEILERTKKPDADLVSIREEIESGEEYFDSLSPDRVKTKRKTTRSNRKGKPFKRKPERIPPGNRI